MKKDNKLILRIVYTSVMIVLLFSLLFSTITILNRPIQSNYSYFYKLAENNKVFDVKVSDKKISFKDESNNKYVIYRITSDGVIDKLHQYSQPYILEPSSNSYIPLYIFLLVLGATCYYIYNKYPTRENDSEEKISNAKAFPKQTQARDFFMVDIPRKSKTSMFSQMTLEDMLVKSDVVSPQEIVDNNTDPLKKFTVRDTNRELYMPQNLEIDDEKFNVLQSDVDRMVKAKSREEWNDYYTQQMIDAGLSDGIVQEKKSKLSKTEESTHPVVESKLKNKSRQGPSRVGRLRQKSTNQTIINQPGAIIKQALKQEGFNED